MALYRIVRDNGSVEYTDVPSGAGRVEALRPGAGRQDDPSRQDDTKTAEALIREAQKRIPKAADYLDYLDYLRHNSPVRFDHVMNELRQQDPQTWIKLQKHPQFRPLRETAVGIKAGSNMLGAGIGLSTGNFTGSVEKWMESTLKDLMKRDRFGPYADVLGAKATTLPTKPATYSNSRLGQFMKVEDANLAAASRAASRDLELSRAGLRAAKGTSMVRVGGTAIDAGFIALDPETATSAIIILMSRRLETLTRRNPEIDRDTPAYEQAHRLLSQGRYGELDKLLKQYE